MRMLAERVRLPCVCVRKSYHLYRAIEIGKARRNHFRLMKI